MNIYRFSNALNYTHAQLSEMHNASFQGYFVPVEMTAEMNANFWRHYQIDANCSVAMHDHHGTFIGFARVGSRGKRGWCGGFGIVPAFRGSGASVALASEMVAAARTYGLETLQLEVLAQNIRAIKLYERAGFVIDRGLSGLEIATHLLPSVPPLPLEMVPLESVLVRLGQRTHPYWGYELASLLVLCPEAFATADGSAGLLIQRGDGQIRIAALFGEENLSDRELAALFRFFSNRVSGIQIYNEPAESPLLARYQRLGFAELFRQHEMVLSL